MPKVPVKAGNAGGLFFVGQDPRLYSYAKLDVTTTWAFTAPCRQVLVITDNTFYPIDMYVDLKGGTFLLSNLFRFS
jgi:hypothetical protein